MNLKSAAILLGLLLAAVSSVATDAPAVIPQPQKMDLQSGTFTLTATTRIHTDSAARVTGQYLAAHLRPGTGFPFKTSTPWFSSGSGAGNILLITRNADATLGAEGYELTVTPTNVVICAPTQAGLFYGVQTLLQLLPPEIFSSNVVANAGWQIPCLHIRDWPRFQWRGFMLDVSRHFFTKAEVETFLDTMALHKLNTFHWHLTDDQGWRIQIKKYPRLTEIGAWRPDVGFGFPSNSTTAYGPDGRYGGFYTQDDIREVLKYAAALHITVVPEIEMPGHSTAALAAYPQYSCSGGPFEINTTGGIFKGIYDPANEQAYKFLGDILAEVSALFPGAFIHIGGDEVPKDTWKKSADCQALMKREGLKNEDELQSWFTRRIEKIVNANGHRMIGWSEILHGGLPPNAAVMDWIGGAREAAVSGHDVVMSPTKYCYFDYYQTTNHAIEPKAAGWGPALTLAKMYGFEPMPSDVSSKDQSHILGAQGNLWTEQVPNFRHVEYMTYPRACALAEVTWSSKDSRDWDDFMRCLKIHVQRFDELNINYRHAAIDTPEPNSLQ